LFHEVHFFTKGRWSELKHFGEFHAPQQESYGSISSFSVSDSQTLTVVTQDQAVLAPTDIRLK